MHASILTRKHTYTCHRTHAYMHTYTHTHACMHAQIAAIREGFTSVVPAMVLPLFTWRQIEIKTCGNAEIDIDTLKKMTSFDMPGGENHRVAAMFWNQVKSFSNDDRAALLGFASGRRRLPAGMYTCMYVCMHVCMYM